MAELPTTRQSVERLLAEGRTQRQVADVLGVSPRAVRQIKTGEKPYNNLREAAELAARGNMTEARLSAEDSRRSQRVRGERGGRRADGGRVVRMPGGDHVEARRPNVELYNRIVNMGTSENVSLVVTFEWLVTADGQYLEHVPVTIGGRGGLSLKGLRARGIGLTVRTFANAIRAAAIEAGALAVDGQSEGVNEAGPIESVAAFFRFVRRRRS